MKKMLSDSLKKEKNWYSQIHPEQKCQTYNTQHRKQLLAVTIYLHLISKCFYTVHFSVAIVFTIKSWN